VPRMKRSRKIAIWLITLPICVIGVWSILAWFGVFDTAPYSITQSVNLAPGQIAMVGIRSDQTAMVGYEYFVLISDHVYSPTELRRYFHRSIFSAGTGAFTIEKDSPSELVIRCRPNCGITKDIIETQEFSKGNIKIRYVGFP
jgi:hypothetical protein